VRNAAIGCNGGPHSFRNINLFNKLLINFQLHMFIPSSIFLSSVNLINSIARYHTIPNMSNIVKESARPEDVQPCLVEDGLKQPARHISRGKRPHDRTTKSHTRMLYLNHFNIQDTEEMLWSHPSITQRSSSHPSYSLKTNPHVPKFAATIRRGSELPQRGERRRKPSTATTTEKKGQTSRCPDVEDSDAKGLDQFGKKGIQTWKYGAGKSKSWKRCPTLRHTRYRK
jgi:hypothetical protein